LKSDGEIMEILAAFDLTGSLRAAAELVGCSHHTVAAHVAARDAGRPVGDLARRPQVTDPFLDKIEEWVEASKGRIRADKAHEKLLALGYGGSDRSTRRAVAGVKAAYRLGHVRVHRPWITEPGMWLQYDFGDGPVVEGVKTVLFVAWLAWSRFRVVIALRDRTQPSVIAALDRTFRLLGGAPTFVLTDNEKTVTVEHIAHVAVRHPQVVAAGRHYGMQVATCVPFDLGKEFLLQRQILRYRLDHIVGVTHRLGETGARPHAGNRAVIFAEFAQVGGDARQRGVEARRVHVRDRDRMAGAGKDLGDAVAHEAGADDGDARVVCIVGHAQPAV